MSAVLIPPIRAGNGGVTTEQLDALPGSGNMPVLVSAQGKHVLPGGTPAIGKALVYSASGQVEWGSITRESLGLAATDNVAFGAIESSGNLTVKSAEGLLFGTSSGIRLRPFTWDPTGASGLELVNPTTGSTAGTLSVNSFAATVSYANAVIGANSKFILDQTGWVDSVPSLSFASNGKIGFTSGTNAGVVTEWIERSGSGALAAKKTGGDATFSCLGTQFRGGPANPTTSDVPAGSSTLWNNTATNELRLWANVSGTLKSVLLS